MERNLFYSSDRKEWREWLATHFETEKEVWFVFPAKLSGEPSILYNDAVEEALCFGWIDGQAGTLDETFASALYTAPERKPLFAAEHRAADLAGEAGDDPSEDP